MMIRIILNVLLVDLNCKLLLLYTSCEHLFIRHEGGVTVAPSSTTFASGSGDMIYFAHPIDFFYVHNFWRLATECC